MQQHCYYWECSGFGSFHPHLQNRNHITKSPKLLPNSRAEPHFFYINILACFTGTKYSADKNLVPEFGSGFLGAKRPVFKCTTTVKLDPDTHFRL